MRTSNFSSAYVTIGDFVRAETNYVKAKDIVAQVKGTNSTEYASLLDELGSLYELMEEHKDDVESVFRDSLAIREKVQSDAHPDYAFTLYELAGWYERTGRFKMPPCNCSTR
jgi:hypothetical protein